MIKSLEILNFKKYKKNKIEIKSGVSFITGGNNEGKSTLLHALIVWDFCKRFLIFHRNKKALCTGYKGDGVGLSLDDFTPINIPHFKYLWYNMQPSKGYNLSIKCTWNSHNEDNNFLEIGLALSNERLFIKTVDTNLNENSYIPNVTYLPSCSGILDKEKYYYASERQKLIGQGLAGSVLRNVILDMYLGLQKDKESIKGDKKRLSAKDSRYLDGNNSFCVLNQMVLKNFNCRLKPQQFDPNFNNYVSILLEKGYFDNGNFKPYKNLKDHDIMVEGNGFLQCLSVYTFALDKNTDVLLLDEPDTHLHCQLQTLLVNDLIRITQKTSKQILFATHSVDLIKSIPVKRIMEIRKNKCRYLEDFTDLEVLISGLGTEYSHKFESIQKNKRILFVENDSDATFLKIFAQTLNLKWPINITIWATATKHKERKQMAEFIKKEIPDIKIISLVDLDKGEYNSTLASLHDKDMPKDNMHSNIRYRKWRRHEIENYLLCIDVLSRVSKLSKEEVNEFFMKEHGICLPDTSNFIQSNCNSSSKVIFEIAGKDLLRKFLEKYPKNKFDIAKEFKKEEICVDIQTIIDEINSYFC